MKFLFIGALFIISDNQLLMSEQHNRDTFLNLYVDWLSSLYDKGVELTAYVVFSEWLPVQKNESVSNDQAREVSLNKARTR